MSQNLALITVVVHDYDEAIAYYTRALGFVLETDDILSPDKRWVVVRPPGSSAALLLAKAANPDQATAVGRQAGGRVFLFLHTDDFWRDYHSMKDQNVRFCEEPRSEEYGTVVVFEDLYGNRFDLIERVSP